ncbi:M48 family peptidase [Pseudoflavonifractor sp. 524-17]|mgnify:FL=1|uniref:M48 family metallopeptidase n=1 Tax=Pseudoflavonifractor sp. 524-17 TaxID=2304577 RepID=UPI00137A5E51|nr:SprT family zinc-dependent metalloprotease [Pseudoflavonifractor sp. 524-17]NCE66245.1 M48 family peptidase [Pseudoflavonifractor sp. 524-17]
MAQERTVLYEGSEIRYVLEEKPVKNLNLRIHKDCKVYVSASPDIPAEKVDGFVISKGNYIRSAQGKFLEMAHYALQPRQYVSGETFYLLGRGVRLKVEKNAREEIFSDGIYLYLCIKDPDDFAKKQRMVTRYLDEQCRIIFGEIISETYPVFQKYGISMPALRIRNMETRWGSCLAKKGIITLNKRLLEVPRNCIEYVVTHEFCHFIHPNHSRHFYDFLTTLMPDWRERKKTLDKSAVYWV